MSALVRLYPRAWRDRYEEEFVALLEARPPTFPDRFDIVRGAIDARLHPQVRAPDAAPLIPDQRAADLLVARRLGIAALAGAAVWIAAWVVAINGPVIYEASGSYRDGAAAMPIILLSVVLLIGGLTGQLIWLPSSARLARGGAILAIPFLVMWAFSPWLIVAYLGWAAGLITLAAGGVRSHSWPVAAAALLVASLVVLTTVGVLGFGGLISMPQEVGSLMMAALGVPLWLVVGGSLVAGASAPRLRPA